MVIIWLRTYYVLITYLYEFTCLLNNCNFGRTYAKMIVMDGYMYIDIMDKIVQKYDLKDLVLVLVK